MVFKLLIRVRQPPEASLAITGGSTPWRALAGASVKAEAALDAAITRRATATALRAQIARLGSPDRETDWQEIARLRSLAELAERDVTDMLLQARAMRAEADSLKAQFDIKPWSGMCQAFAPELLDDTLQRVLSEPRKGVRNAP